MKKTIPWILVLLFWLPIPLSADKVYTWKDKDGVFRSSNEPPPEHVKDFSVHESSAVSAPNAGQSDQRRPSYDKMVERSKREAEASQAQRKKEADAKAAEKKRIAEEKEKERIQAERKRLESEIEAIKKRAVSPTYPNGMKQAQIKALQKEIEALEKGAGNPSQKTDASNQK